MDNSVDYSTCFQNYTDREFWTRCNPITRILYNYVIYWEIAFNYIEIYYL